MKKQINIEKSGFTLAEVLITLVIIGVIAAITVPTLYANYQEQALKSALRKGQSIIAQALKFYYLDYGKVAKGSDFEARTFKEVFKNHFNVIKDYGNTDYYYFDKNPDKYKTYNGTKNVNHYIFDDGQFDLADGSFIMIENPSAGADNNRVFIAIDVNGHEKNPNRLGKDLFLFQVDNDGKLLPMGDPGTFYPKETYCNKSSDSSDMNGAGCTSEALSKK